MDLLVATIEHSGTFTLLGLLDYENRHIASPRERRDGLLFTHLYDSHMEAILEAASRMPSITTHRPVEDIRASWVRRGKDLAELNKQLLNYSTFVLLAKPYVVHLGERR